MTLHAELTRKKGGRHKKLRDARELEHLHTYLDKFAAQPKRANKCNDARLDAAIDRQQARMLKLREDIYWNAELDSNAGLGAEYIMMLHFLGIANQPQWAERQRKIANFTRNWQNADGSWSIYAKGPGHLSYSVTC